MEEVRKALFERVIKRYTLADIVKHQTLGSGQRNLIELISRYPGQGTGFKVFKKTWNEGHFYHVKDVQMFVSKSLFIFLTQLFFAFQNGRYGKVYGYLYKNGQMEKRKIEKVPRVLQRGLWQFEAADPAYTKQNVTLDNGNVTNLTHLQKMIGEKNALIKGRKAAMEYKVTAEADDE